MFPVERKASNARLISLAVLQLKFILNVDDQAFHSTIVLNTTAVPILPWVAPPSGWVKINTGGSLGPDGVAGAGIIIRDQIGENLLSSCRHPRNCRDALDAEISAVKEGLMLALQWSNKPLVIEVDFLEIVVKLHTLAT
jgi:hypothetical protein